MHTTTVPTPAPTRAGARQWLGLTMLALPSLLLSLDVTLLHLAVPHLAAALRPDGTRMLWIIDIYGFMIAGLLVTMGTLGDRIGRRRLLLVGATLFGAASVAAAYATSAEMLIAARALLGLAGATLMPSTMALIGNMFRDARQRGVAFGVWAASFSVGIALGPVVGGLMLERFWWGSVFLLAVPVMVLLLLTGPFLLPEFKDDSAGRIDLASVALSMAAILPLVYGVKQAAAHGFTGPTGLALLAGTAFGALFVRRQLRSADPLLDLSLFRNRSFTVALGVMLAGAFAIGGAYLFITQFLQMVAGLSPFQAGLRLLPAAVLLIISSTLAPVLARKAGAGIVVGAAMLVSAAGYAVLAFTGADGTGIVVVGFALVYIGIGPMMALSIDLVVGAAPPEKAGAASAIQETMSEFGLALGIAVVGSVGMALYRDELSGNMPAGVPGEAREAGRDALSGALDAAAGLPAELGGEFLAVARDAFSSGLSAAAVIGAILSGAVGILAATVLRRVGR